MYRLTRFASRKATLAFALLSAIVAPATLNASGFDELSKLAGPDLGTMFKQALQGNPAEGVTIEELADGLVQITVPSSIGNKALSQRQAKDLLNCAIYIGLLEPNFSAAGILRFDAAPIAEFPYRAGWLVYNSSSDAVEAQSTLKTKGPGPDLKIDALVTYAPNSFSAVFGTYTSGWKAGFQSISVKVKGAKPSKLKGTFCPGCDF